MAQAASANQKVERPSLLMKMGFGRLSGFTGGDKSRSEISVTQADNNYEVDGGDGLFIAIDGALAPPDAAIMPT